MGKPGHYIHGVAWSVLNAGTGVLIPLGLFVLFARLLAPAEVGLVALAVAVAEMLKPLGAPGLYEALLQHPDTDGEMHQAASAFLIAAGLCLVPFHALIIAGLSYWVTGVADHQLALSIIGLRIALDLATIQPQARLAQKLSFRRLALRSVFANLTAGATGVTIAALGAPFAGLITYQVGQSLLIFLSSIWGRNILARPAFHWRQLRQLAREGALASAVRLVSATNNYLDQILIATVIGSQKLAYFNLAKRVETTFITAASSFSSILFQPMFASVQRGERDRSLRRSLAVLTITCGLPAAFFVVNRDAIVAFVFGSQWGPAADIAAVLAISGFARALGGVHGALLSVSGRNRQLLWISSFSAVSGVLIVLPASAIGLLGVATALAAKNIAFAGAEAYLTRDDAPSPIRAYTIEVFLPFFLMLCCGWGGRVAGETLSAAGDVGRIGVILLSGLTASLCAGLYFVTRYSRDLRRFYAARQGVASI